MFAACVSDEMADDGLPFCCDSDHTDHKDVIRAHLEEIARLRAENETLLSALPSTVEPDTIELSHAPAVPAEPAEEEKTVDSDQSENPAKTEKSSFVLQDKEGVKTSLQVVDARLRVIKGKAQVIQDHITEVAWRTDESNRGSYFLETTNPDGLLVFDIKEEQKILAQQLCSKAKLEVQEYQGFGKALTDSKAKTKNVRALARDVTCAIREQQSSTHRKNTRTLDDLFGADREVHDMTLHYIVLHYIILD